MRRKVFIVAYLAIGICSRGAYAQQPPIVLGAERIAETTDGPSASEGRVLMSELGCASCHNLTGFDSKFRKSGPNLIQIGTRVNPEFLRAWLNDPHTTKPGTVMPDVIPNGPHREAIVQELLIFLLNQNDAIVNDTSTEDHTLIDEGERLYHSVGCVACHQPFREPTPRIGGDDEYSEQIVEHQEIRLPNVPLPNLRAKSNKHALAEFLMDPLATRPSGRMPNMKLSPAESKAIATYLLSQGDVAVPITDPIDLSQERYQRGQEAFTRLGCVACHTTGSDMPQARIEIAIKDANAGCLASDRSATAPWYGLSDQQRDSIKLALAADEPPNPSQSLREHIASLNCLACHLRDDLGGIENGRLPYFSATIEADLGDEGRIPPPLTGVGAKLTEVGLTSMLVGDASVRSYMATRMPRFGAAQVGDLPELLKLDEDPDAPAIDVSGLLLHHRNHYGRDLLGTSGFGCVGCHNLYGAKSLGIPAIDLATVPDRIQPTWFKQYLLDPSALRPGTRMPSYFEDNVSPVSRVLRGNVEQQIEAMWIYLREIDQTRLPEGLEDRGDFELKPEDRPIILRTFMTDVGTHAIAVGYPEGIHIAFDALNVRLALAWKGNFIDAESTWADRFSPLASPMSDQRYAFPEGAAVSFADVDPADLTTRFRGYSLDNQGVPTFMYTLQSPQESVNIEETIRAQTDGSFVRRFSITGNEASTLHIRAPQSGEPPIEVAPSSEVTTVEQIWRPQW